MHSACGMDGCRVFRKAIVPIVLVVPLAQAGCGKPAESAADVSFRSGIHTFLITEVPYDTCWDDSFSLVNLGLSGELIVDSRGEAVVEFTGIADAYIPDMVGLVLDEQLIASGQSTVPVSPICSLRADSTLLGHRPDPDSRHESDFDAVISVRYSSNVLNEAGTRSDCTAELSNGTLGEFLPFPELDDPSGGSCSIRLVTSAFLK